jgi:hypothetical protein
MSELPDVLQLSPDSIGLRLSPNEMRSLKQATGHTLEALLGEEAEMADRMQTIVWVKLRRNGHPELTWEEAGDVVVEFVAADPTNGGPSTSSPDSVDTGG